MNFNSIVDFLKYCKTIKKNSSHESRVYVLDIKKIINKLIIKCIISYQNSKMSYIISLDIEPNNVNIYCPCQNSNCKHIDDVILYLLKNNDLELHLLQLNLIGDK